MDLTKDLNNLVKIESAKKDITGKYRKSSKGQDIEISYSEFEMGIYQMLCGKFSVIEQITGKLDEEYWIYLDEKRVPTIMRHDKERNVYQIVLEEHLASYLFDFINSRLNENLVEEVVTWSSCLKSVNSWMYQFNSKYNNRIIKEYPKITAFKSDDTIPFQRLSYDPIECNELFFNAPIFFEMLTRMTNSEAFCKFIGKMWVRGSDRKQSVWLWGAADSGKSQIAWLMKEIVGGSLNTAVLTDKDLGGSHFKEPLINKQLWLVNEAPVKLINSSSYKSLTGDGTHQINPKGRSAYVAELKGVFLFSSNEKPVLKDDDALWARIIPCGIRKLESKMMDEDELRELLKKEIPYIVGYCIKKFKENGKVRIDCDQTSIKEAVEETEFELQNIFDQHFAVDDNCIENPTLSCAEFQKIVDPHSHYNAGRAKVMRDFIEKKYGCKFGVRKRIEGSQTRCITGIRKLTYKEKLDLMGE